MVMVKTRMRLTLGLAALAGLAACGGGGNTTQASGDLQRDLQLAGSQPSLELLPNASRTAVVSAIEQTGTAEPAPSPTKVRAPVARPAPRRVAPQATVARAPSPAPQRQIERPSPRPTFDANVISPAPPGGYKTMGEIMRNAPFPINP
jgi:hypothetical protein